MTTVKMPLRIPIEQIRWPQLELSKLQLEINGEMLRLHTLNNAHAKANDSPALSCNQLFGDKPSGLDANFAGFHRVNVIENTQIGQSTVFANTNPLGTHWDSARLGGAYESL